jgi:hypothetical protein
MKPKNNILQAANLQSISSLKETTQQKLIHLVLSRHYLAGLAAQQLAIRLPLN